MVFEQRNFLQLVENVKYQVAQVKKFLWYCLTTHFFCSQAPLDEQHSQCLDSQLECHDVLGHLKSFQFLKSMFFHVPEATTNELSFEFEVDRLLY